MKRMRAGGKVLAVAISLAGLFGIASESKAEVDMWPLLEMTKDSTTVCYPCYTSEGDFKMILDFYAKTNNGKDTHFFWPFVKFSDGKLVRVAPFWFKENPEEFVLFPLIKQDKESVLWTVPPVYTRKDGTFTAAIPFFIKNEHSLFVFPDIYIKERYGRKSVDVFPFYSHAYSTSPKSEDFSLRVLNYAYKNDSEEKTSTFFPLYARMDRKLEKPKGALYAGIYYNEWDKSQNLSKYVLAPFFSTKKSDSENYTWAFNYYSYKSERESEFTIFPFYGTKKIVKFRGTRTKESTWVLWPLYAKEEVRDPKGELLSRKKRFMFFSNTLKKNGHRTFSILGQIVREKLN